MTTGQHLALAVIRGVFGAAAVLLVIAVGWACATEVLYLNKDNKGWQLQNRLYTSHDDCDQAARRAIRNGEALGAGCAVYVPATGGPEWRGQQPDGYKTKDQQRIDERQQIYDNRRERFENKFYRPTP